MYLHAQLLDHQTQHCCAHVAVDLRRHPALQPNLDDMQFLDPGRSRFGSLKPAKAANHRCTELTGSRPRRGFASKSSMVRCPRVARLGLATWDGRHERVRPGGQRRARRKRARDPKRGRDFACCRDRARQQRRRARPPHPDGPLVLPLGPRRHNPRPLLPFEPLREVHPVIGLGKLPRGRHHRRESYRRITALLRGFQEAVTNHPLAPTTTKRGRGFLALESSSWDHGSPGEVWGPSSGLRVGQAGHAPSQEGAAQVAPPSRPDARHVEGDEPREPPAFRPPGWLPDRGHRTHAG